MFVLRVDYSRYLSDSTLFTRDWFARTSSKQTTASSADITIGPRLPLKQEKLFPSPDSVNKASRLWVPTRGYYFVCRTRSMDDRKVAHWHHFLSWSVSRWSRSCSRSLSSFLASRCLGCLRLHPLIIHQQQSGSAGLWGFGMCSTKYARTTSGKMSSCEVRFIRV